MARNNGGPMLPIVMPPIVFPDGSLRDSYVLHEGLALRDYFAAHALPAVLAYHDRGLAQQDALPCDAIAREAYAIADAMLAERER